VEYRSASRIGESDGNYGGGVLASVGVLVFLYICLSLCFYGCIGTVTYLTVLEVLPYAVSLIALGVEEEVHECKQCPRVCVVSGCSLALGSVTYVT